jgi:hypothetical protein
MLLFLLCNGFRIIVLRDSRNLAAPPVLNTLLVALRFSFLSSAKVATEVVSSSFLYLKFKALTPTRIKSSVSLSKKGLIPLIKEGIHTTQRIQNRIRNAVFCRITFGKRKVQLIVFSLYIRSNCMVWFCYSFFWLQFLTK